MRIDCECESTWQGRCSNVRTDVCGNPKPIISTWPIQSETSACVIVCQGNAFVSHHTECTFNWNLFEHIQISPKLMIIPRGVFCSSCTLSLVYVAVFCSHWKLSHSNEHIVEFGDSETDRLSVAIVYAICLINMMKMIFVFKAQTAGWMQRRNYEMEKRLHQIALFAPTTPSTEMERVRKNLNQRCNHNVYMRFFCCEYNFKWKLPLPRAQREISPLQRYHFRFAQQMDVFWVCAICVLCKSYQSNSAQKSHVYFVEMFRRRRKNSFISVLHVN